jgi:hypothetical protein
MTGTQYWVEILDVYVRPYAGAVGPEFILMDDKARPHKARVVEQYLQQETIVCMDWPLRSPDLNPLEYVWNMLQVALSHPRAQPMTLAELGNALVQEWNNLPIEIPGCLLTACFNVVKLSLMQEEAIPCIGTLSTY